MTLDYESATWLMMPEEKIAATTSIACVSVKVPPIWWVNPEIWSSQMKSEFILAGITMEITKFHHVDSTLQPEELEIVVDIILSPPAVKPYMTLSEPDSAHNMLNQKNSAYVA
ncbi:uncharacterized protein TNCV_3698131 [Trichonephila clavipes]|uniref:DUF7041 domain-containing protein n=1 Tax=Trichonephila clavipes TaxID=2585209 RepID=A0A8X6SB24_TRICX|nr:uncharacterized protein TNCV_3698131 [Trichonephila clavipes]